MALFDLDFITSPYQMEQVKKDEIFTKQMIALTKYHQENCSAYNQILSACGFDENKIAHYSGLPFLPAGLFKRLRLSSLSNMQSEFKTVTSSGTTSRLQSQIILDGETRTLQQQALAAIGSDFISKIRIPLLVIDCPDTINKRNNYSARTSGILGFSLFGSHRTFALHNNMSINQKAVKEFLKQYGSGRFMIFGFTFMIWKCFLLELEKQGLHPDMSNGILIHGGGWKKLQNESVSKEIFKRRLHQVCGLAQIHDYYGMAEQTGSIFMECEYGHLHCSDYSGVLIRRAQDFSLCDIGEKGMIQILSVLPLSYPGHNLLTEDEGMLLGVDDCPCGRKGAYFQVNGRLKNAEVRGCSDTYEGI